MITVQTKVLFNVSKHMLSSLVTLSDLIWSHIQNMLNFDDVLNISSYTQNIIKPYTIYDTVCLRLVGAHVLYYISWCTRCFLCDLFFFLKLSFIHTKTFNITIFMHEITFTLRKIKIYFTRIPWCYISWYVKFCCLLLFYFLKMKNHDVIRTCFF